MNDGRYQDDVFVYDLSGNLQGSWRLSYNVNPRGITINPGDVNDIWIVDNKYDKVYEYTGGAFFTSGTHAPDTKWRLASGNTKPQGIADPPPVTPDATLDTVAQDRALAGFASLLDLMPSNSAASRDGTLLDPIPSGRQVMAEVTTPTRVNGTVYAAVSADKESLFADDAEEFDAFDDDTTLDTIFAELGQDESPNEALVNVR